MIELNITLNKSNSAEGLLTIALSEEDYRPGVDKKIREYTRKAAVKGFRKGKVPSSIINKMYGAPILAEEVNEIVSHSISKYIADNKLKIIGEPLPDREKANAVDWNSQKEFTFEFQIGLVDDFTYKLSPKVKLKTYRIEIDDSTIDETVTNLQKQFGQVTHPDISESTDQLSGELAGETGESGDTKKYHINIDIADLKKETQKEFIGKKVGDLINFDVDKLFPSSDQKAQFIDSFHLKDVTRQKEVCQLQIEAISRVKAADIDQPLFDSVFGKDSIQNKADFMAKVKTSIEQQYSQETERLLDQHIQAYFTENTRVKMPETFLKAWIKQRSNNKIELSELDAALETHKKMLKWNLIKSRIIDDLAIQVTPEEVTQAAKELIAKQYWNVDRAQLASKLDAMTTQYLSADQGANFARLQEHLLNQHLLKTIKQKITLTEKLVSVTDFRKVAKKVEP